MKITLSSDDTKENIETNNISNSYQSKELIEKIKEDNYNNWRNQKGISESFESHEDWKKRKRLGIKYISDVVTAPQLIKHLDGKRIATVGGLKLITDFSKLAKDINAIYIRDFIPEETDIIVSSNIYFDDFIKNDNSDVWKNIKINFPDLIIIRESEFLKSLGFKVPKSECKGEAKVNELENYTVIDLETTDRNAKTCEIIELAAVKIRNNEIFDTFSTLVKPNNKIPYIVTQKNNITNEMVENAPVINDVFKEYLDFIGDDIVLGHNIDLYDMPIIRRYCDELNSDPLNNDTLDTLKFSRKCDIDVPDHKLTTLTKYFEIEHKNAHRALADCIANHECYQKLKKLYNPLNASKVIKNKTSGTRKWNTKLSEETLRLKELNEMVNDIIADDVLTDKEVNLLSNWLNANQHLSGNYPFDTIYKAVSEVLEDGIITNEEKAFLLDVLSNFSNPVESYSENIDNIDLTAKQIVLTGDFVNGTKAEIVSKLEMLGAIVKSGVSSKTDYVIVGGYGSDNWACGNYGSKVKKALELQSKGKDVKIIKEEEFFKCLKATV